MRQGFFQDFLVWFLVVGTLFFIRDIILIFGIPKDVQHEVIDWAKLRRERTKEIVPFSSVLLLWNRTLLFPFLLVLYIIVILLKQLDISVVSDILSARSWIEYSLLGGVALSGFGTIFRESVDSHYQKKVIDYRRTRGFVLVVIFLALLAVGIVFHETTSLGLLSIPISMISGLLIFLVGILFLEGDEDEQNPPGIDADKVHDIPF